MKGNEEEGQVVLCRLFGGAWLELWARISVFLKSVAALLFKLYSKCQTNNAAGLEQLLTSEQLHSCKHAIISTSCFLLSSLNLKPLIFLCK